MIKNGPKRQSSTKVFPYLFIYLQTPAATTADDPGQPYTEPASQYTPLADTLHPDEIWDRPHENSDNAGRDISHSTHRYSDSHR